MGMAIVGYRGVLRLPVTRKWKGSESCVLACRGHSSNCILGRVRLLSHGLDWNDRVLVTLARNNVFFVHSTKQRRSIKRNMTNHYAVLPSISLVQP
jgi:hypothetical protein